MLPTPLVRIATDGPEQPRRDPEIRSLPSLLVPLVGSVLQTYGAVWLLCTTPYRESLHWVAWLRAATGYLLITFLAHATAVWVNRRLFRGLADAPGRALVVAIWPAVVWLPLLVLLTREQSAWSVVVVPSVLMAAAATALQRWTGQTGATAEAPTVVSLFAWAKPKPFLRAMAPALGCSALGYAAVVEALRGEWLGAGWLLGGCTGLCVWRSPTRPTPLRRMDRERGWRGVLPRTVFVWLLLLLALLPYVGSKRLASAFGGALGARPRRNAAAKDHPIQRARDSSYSGVILLYAAKPHHEMVAPPPPASAVHAGLRERRPVVIPFDGAYWFFKQPDERPRADAPVVRGDPRHKNVRSTDNRPLAMEAHQRLDPPMPIRCCRALRLEVHNADTELGAIVLEVQLRTRLSKPTATVSLGTEVLPSSVRSPAGVGGAPDALIFSFPAASGRLPLKTFDEIVVVIRPRSDRARAGAHVAIESFELLP